MHLATAWLTATRTAGLVGGQDAKGRTLSALGPDLDRSAAPEVRHRVLALLAALPRGTSPDPETAARPAPLGAAAARRLHLRRGTPPTCASRLARGR